MWASEWASGDWPDNANLHGAPAAGFVKAAGGLTLARIDGSLDEFEFKRFLAQRVAYRYGFDQGANFSVDPDHLTYINFDASALLCMLPDVDTAGALDPGTGEAFSMQCTDYDDAYDFGQIACTYVVYGVGTLEVDLVKAKFRDEIASLARSICLCNCGRGISSTARRVARAS